MTCVMLVDDETEILDSTAEYLELSGFEVVKTTVPEEVLGLMREARPDVVFHDLRMPGLDLLAQVRLIRKDPDVGNTVLVVFTASAGAVEIADRIGADGAVEKPFDPAELVAMVTRFAGR